MTKIISKRKVWPVDGSFRIAHGSLTEIEVVQVEITNAGFTGRGECRPYARYDETPESVLAQIRSVTSRLETAPTHENLQRLLPAGAARNALDCALWDLKAKTSGKPVWQLLPVPQPRPRQTAFTLSVDTPVKMARAAKQAHIYPVLKLKIDGSAGLQACQAVMDSRPDAQLIIDANEALAPNELREFRNKLKDYPVLMIEQPLKAADFDRIENAPGQLPVLCADESLHTTADLQKLWATGYRAINVKLDKCGGLSEAYVLMQTAKKMGFVIMTGCMVGSSLAMAPMMMLESFADVIDLDGPLLLKNDIANGLVYAGATVYPPKPELWG